MSVTRSIELTGPLKTPHPPSKQAMKGSRVKASSRFVQILEQSRRRSQHAPALPYSPVSPSKAKEEKMLMSKQLPPFDMTEKDWMLLKGLEICSEALNTRKTTPIPTAVKQFTPSRRAEVETVPFENSKIRSIGEKEPQLYQEITLESPHKLCLSDFDDKMRRSVSKSPPKKEKQATGSPVSMKIDGRNCQTADGKKNRARKRRESFSRKPGGGFERYPKSMNLLDSPMEQQGKQENEMSPYLTQKIVTRMIRATPAVHSPYKSKQMSQSLPDSQVFEESKEFSMKPISQQGPRKRNRNSRVEIRNEKLKQRAASAKQSKQKRSMVQAHTVDFFQPEPRRDMSAFAKFLKFRSTPQTALKTSLQRQYFQQLIKRYRNAKVIHQERKSASQAESQIRSRSQQEQKLSQRKAIMKEYTFRVAKREECAQTPEEFKMGGWNFGEMERESPIIGSMQM